MWTTLILILSSVVLGLAIGVLLYDYWIKQRAKERRLQLQLEKNHEIYLSDFDETSDDTPTTEEERVAAEKEANQETNFAIDREYVLRLKNEMVDLLKDMTEAELIKEDQAAVIEGTINNAYLEYEE